eukprot:776702-Amphidinium_carterae.1
MELDVVGQLRSQIQQREIADLQVQKICHIHHRVAAKVDSGAPAWNRHVLTLKQPPTLAQATFAWFGAENVCVCVLRIHRYHAWLYKAQLKAQAALTEKKKPAQVAHLLGSISRANKSFPLQFCNVQHHPKSGYLFPSGT